MCDICGLISVITIESENKNYCWKCFFEIYPNVKLSIPHSIDKEGIYDDVRLSSGKPIIIFGPLGIYATTCLYILYRSKLPDDILEIVDNADYGSMWGHFFERCKNLSDEWFLIYDDSDRKEVRDMLSNFKGFDKIIQITEDSTDEDKILEIDELLERL